MPSSQVIIWVSHFDENHEIWLVSYGFTRSVNRTESVHLHTDKRCDRSTLHVLISHWHLPLIFRLLVQALFRRRQENWTILKFRKNSPTYHWIFSESWMLIRNHGTIMYVDMMVGSSNLLLSSEGLSLLGQESAFMSPDVAILDHLFWRHLGRLFFGCIETEFCK